MSTAPTVDVHAHVLLPEVEAPVAGLPGHTEAKALDARRNGPAALAVSGASPAPPGPGCRGDGGVSPPSTRVRSAGADSQGEVSQ